MFIWKCADPSGIRSWKFTASRTNGNTAAEFEVTTPTTYPQAKKYAAAYFRNRFMTGLGKIIIVAEGAACTPCSTN